MKKTMAYKSKGMKAPRPEQSMEAGEKQASMAPQTKPSMKHSEAQGPFSTPKGGEQSAAPSHKKQALTMQDAPKGVSSVNGGSSVSLPKSGGVGESEV